MERMRRSPQYAGGRFHNPVPTGTMSMSPGDLGAMLRGQFGRAARARRAPAAPVPLHRSLPDGPPASGLRLTWTGHSSVLAEIDGHRVLFDPVWGERCSPFAFAGPRRLHPVPLPLAELLPVDVVVISHDHYDHLDMGTIRALAAGGTRFAVPLGVGADLEHWGVDPAHIEELDWHEPVRIGELTLTPTPARHFCGRALLRMRTLWAAWVVAGPHHRIFHSGDTGWFPGFAETGATYGPFDATMIQIGAYSAHWPRNHTDPTPLPGAWPDIHMSPAQGVRTHLDLQGGRPGGVLLPIHWGTFNLAPHAWAEPGEWTKDAAEEAGQAVAFPRPGEPFEPAGKLPVEAWWREVSAPIDRPWRRPRSTEGAAGTSREDLGLAGER
ncbi:MBL fold metallo-hydrolase [Streptomyces sp. PLAI1-29]|uniref:MBL fold metallo-hydrolase n=1 Tax=Streptomyces zingiberis TaxID=2053010 RepID=A0ABX1C1Y1_9ACTN|nr:MBL fold metallo-hydrolase [Streptomyces zingiberis]